jgi:F-type H+-transporting ATPase subunit delta
MANEQVAKRYAQAVFGIAVDQETIPRWRADLDDIAIVLSESEASPILADSRVSLARREEMVGRILDVQPLALNFARVLLQKGRSLEARAIGDAFGRMADEHQGIVHAQLTSAFDLTAEQVSTIEQRLSTETGKTVKATTLTDPSILGGLIIRIGDTLIDGSIRTRLKRLRRELEGAR